MIANTLFLFFVLLSSISDNGRDSILLQPSPASRHLHQNVRKVVFIAGPDSHGKGEHEHNGGSMLLAKLLNEGLNNVNAVVYQNGWPNDTSALNDADAIVLYCDGGGDHIAIPHLSALDRLMKNGVGLVSLHFALEVPQGVASDYFLKWIGGYFELNYSVNPMWEPQFEPLPNHPVTHGVKPFVLKDEWYYHLRFTDDYQHVTSVLKALPPAETLSRPDGTHSGNPSVRKAVIQDKRPQTVAWTYERPGGGRSFGFSGGHNHSNWANDDFRKLVLNAIAWAAKLEVPKEGITSTSPSPSEMDALTKKVN